MLNQQLNNFLMAFSRCTPYRGQACIVLSVDVRTLLEQERWDDALVKIGDVRKKLTKLYELLQNRNDDLRKLLERIAELEGFKSRVDDLAKEQADETAIHGLCAEKRSRT